MREVYDTAISYDYSDSDVPSSGFEEDPIMSLNGALRLNKVYPEWADYNEGTRIFLSGNDAIPSSGYHYGIGIDYDLRNTACGTGA